MTAEGTMNLNPDKVLLAICKLDETKNIIWQGTVAKALSNGQIVTIKMVKPFIRELRQKHLIIMCDGPKKFEHVKPVPVIIVTAEGQKKANELKMIKN